MAARTLHLHALSLTSAFAPARPHACRRCDETDRARRAERRERQPRLSRRAVERSDDRNADRARDAGHVLRVLVRSERVFPEAGEMGQRFRSLRLERILVADASLGRERDLLFEERGQDDCRGSAVLETFDRVQIAAQGRCARDEGMGEPQAISEDVRFMSSGASTPMRRVNRPTPARSSKPSITGRRSTDDGEAGTSPERMDRRSIRVTLDARHFIVDTEPGRADRAAGRDRNPRSSDAPVRERTNRRLQLTRRSGWCWRSAESRSRSTCSWLKRGSISSPC